MKKLEDVYLVMYGSRATALVREYGFDVEEMIDSRYVLENDESYKNKKQRAADVIKNAVGKAGGTAVKYAKLFTKDSWTLPKNILMMRKIGKNSSKREQKLLRMQLLRK